VRRVVATGCERIVGQNFTADQDWNRVDLQSYTQTIDYGSKSAKEEYVRVQGNNPRIGGGTGFPIVGAPRTTNFANGNVAWTLNAQGQPQAADAEVRQFLLWVSPHGFVKAALQDPNVSVTDRHFVRTDRTRPARRRTLERGDRGGQAGDSQQADPLPREHP